MVYVHHLLIHLVVNVYIGKYTSPIGRVWAS